MTQVIGPATFTTLADVVTSVGHVPLERILAQPAPGTATEDDVLAIEARENRLCELIDGTLVVKTVGAYEAWLALELGAILRDFVTQRDSGLVLGADGMLRLFPGQVRIPDVSFIAWQQLPDRVFPREPIPDLHPDLAVEVLSAGNTAAEMERKLHDYFRSGTRLVWYVDAARRHVDVYTSAQSVRRVEIGETRDGGDLLPGFTLPLEQLFRVPLA